MLYFPEYSYKTLICHLKMQGCLIITHKVKHFLYMYFHYEDCERTFLIFR